MNLSVIGFGVMGKVFARVLRGYFTVTVWSRTDRTSEASSLGVKFEQNLEKAVSDADVIILAVPLSVFSETCKQISRKIKQDAIAVDICSVKEMPMKVMEKHFQNYLGMHPLFGNTESLRNHKIVICDGKGDSRLFLSMLEKEGANLIYMSPVEHDMLVGEIQGLTHFTGLGLIEYLKKADKEKMKSLSTPTFDLLLSLVERMQVNNPEVFIEIQKHNKYARKARKNLLKKLKELDKSLTGRKARKKAASKPEKKEDYVKIGEDSF